FIALCENDIGSDYLGQAFVEQMDIGLKPREATFVEAPQYSILNMSGLVLDRDMLTSSRFSAGATVTWPFGRCNFVGLCDRRRSCPSTGCDDSVSMENEMLEEQKAVIVGGTSGIGLAAAIELCRARLDDCASTR